MKELQGSSGWGLLGKLKLQPWNEGGEFPGLESLVRDDIRQILESNVCVVPGGLDSVEGVLPPLQAAQGGPSLLQVASYPEGRVLLGGQTSSNSESMAETSITIALIPGASLDDGVEGV